MRTKIYFIFLFALAVGAGILSIRSYQQKTTAHKVVKYSCQQSKITKTVNTLQVSGNLNVVLHEGNYTTVEFSDRTRYRPNYQIRGNKLYISNNRHERRRCGSSNATVYVSMPDLENVQVNGSGKIRVIANQKFEELNLSSTGSADLQIENLNASELNTSIRSSGDIRYNGHVGLHKISINSSGNVYASGLSNKYVKVNINSSGDATVNAGKKLDARINSSGDVHIIGRAKVENISENSSGRAVHMK